MVECTGLENRRTARSRGFESLSLRPGLATWAVSPEPYVRGHPRHVFAACAAAHACYHVSAKTHRFRELPLVQSHQLRTTSDRFAARASHSVDTAVHRKSTEIDLKAKRLPVPAMAMLLSLRSYICLISLLSLKFLCHLP